MNEYELSIEEIDKIVDNLLKIKEKKLESINTFKNELNTIWGKTLIELKKEIKEISFNTWIKDLKPVSIDYVSIKLLTESEFSKGIIEKTYLALIEKAVEKVANRKYNVEIIFKDEKNERI
jgi:hypothetical protein